MYQEIKKTYGIKEEQKRTPSAAAFERKSESNTPANYTYKAALENINTLNLFQQQRTNEPVMQRMIAKSNEKNQTVIYLSNIVLKKFNKYCQKVDPKSLQRQKLKEQFEMVLKSALQTEGVNGVICVQWEPVAPKTIKDYHLHELSSTNTLYYNHRPILLPLLDDLVCIWNHTPYTANTGCVGDSLGVIKGAANIKTNNTDIPSSQSNSLDSPMSQNEIAAKYNGVTFNGKKIEPYYTGGSDIFYRLNGLKLVYRFNPDVPIKKRPKLTDASLSEHLNASSCIVSLGKPGDGHNIAVIDNKVYDMQTNTTWANPTNTNARIKPSECKKELTDYNDYYVEYIYK